MEECDKDDYDVLNQLAKGGQGTTSRVRRKRDNSVWVLKESFVDSTKAGNAALREAKTLQALNHPHINRYHDVFLHQDDAQLVVCMVMEYCEGGDLAHYLIAFKRHNMIVEPDRVLRWMQQMSSAIAYLHAHKIVHRDLKPQNIFMMTEDSLRVGDFGLAQTIERGKRTSQVGTPCYMAPEVLHHDAYAETVDIWGLGCIGLEAVTLDFLWERKGMLAAQVLTQPVHANSMSPEYPSSLRESIAKCLIHSVAKRPSAATLEGALHSAVQSGGDDAGLAQVFGSLASQWTSWLTPPSKGPSLAHIPEETPEHAVLSQMPDTVPCRPEGRPIPVSEQQRLAARDPAHSHDKQGGGLHAIREGSREDKSLRARSSLGASERPTPVAPTSRTRTPAELEAEVSRLLAAAQQSGRMAGAAGAGSPGAESPGWTGDIGAPSIKSDALRMLGAPPSAVNSVLAGRAGAAGLSPSAAQAHTSTQGDELLRFADDVAQSRGGGAGASRGAHRQAGAPMQQEHTDAAPQPPVVVVGLSSSSASPGPDIPPHIMEEYRRNGLFGIDAKWRGAVQAWVQLDNSMRAAQGLGLVDARPGLDGHAPPASLKSSSQALRGSSPASATPKSLGGGVQPYLSVGGKSSPAETGGGEFGGTMAGQSGDRVDKKTPPSKDRVGAMSSLLSSFRGKKKESPGKDEGEILGDKRILVERHSKQYELVYQRQQWLQAREATAQKQGDRYVYASESEIQKTYEGMFGQPSSRFIGNSDNLMAC